NSHEPFRLCALSVLANLLLQFASQIKKRQLTKIQFIVNWRFFSVSNIARKPQLLTLGLMSRNSSYSVLSISLFLCLAS
ncbi:hypothetical protein MK904_13725, partial [Loigolactobacillus coryniformis]|uniref:hypothetical protein n=1 Tax=Loigolactobacillus coryniformis TaxID=1610 RepID=UPI00234257D1